SQLEQLKVEVQAGAGHSEARTLHGEPRARFAREDESRLLQVGRDLLVVNQLQPYPHYEEWRAVVHRTLDVYRGLASPAGIVRLGVRYINQVVVPGESVRMEDYFRIFPPIPPELGGGHGPFMLRLILTGTICPGHHLTLSLG